MTDAVLALANGITGLAAFVMAVGAARALLEWARAAAILAGAVGLGLEFLLAAGLLRLGTVDSLRALAVVAIVVAVRMVAARGVGGTRRALAEGGQAEAPGSTRSQ